MNVIERTFAFLGDGTNWQGSQGILARTVEHLGITMFAVAIALVIAVPLGLWAGHTRRGGHALLGVYRRFARSARPGFVDPAGSLVWG